MVAPSEPRVRTNVSISGPRMISTGSFVQRTFAGLPFASAGLPFESTGFAFGSAGLADASAGFGASTFEASVFGASVLPPLVPPVESSGAPVLAGESPESSDASGQAVSARPETTDLFAAFLEAVTAVRVELHLGIDEIDLQFAAQKLGRIICLP